MTNKIGAIGSEKTDKSYDIKSYIDNARSQMKKIDFKKLIGNSVWTTDAAASYFGAGVSNHGASGIK